MFSSCLATKFFGKKILFFSQSYGKAAFGNYKPLRIWPIINPHFLGFACSFSSTWQKSSAQRGKMKNLQIISITKCGLTSPKLYNYGDFLSSNVEGNELVCDCECGKKDIQFCKILLSIGKLPNFMQSIITVTP